MSAIQPPPIRVLPPAVAARIAAGEVIERPASVVKELVENAFDAGARRVRVDAQGGGLALIRVGDDGHGIPPADLHLACQRHATSKLPDDDLSRVRTLGFRGEALPSIAAVAEITLVSANDDSGIGRRLRLRGGRLALDEPAPRSRGVTVTVQRLFEQVPARLAAAGRAQTEIAQIGQVARRLALAAPGVRLTLMAEGRLIFETTGSGDLATTLAEIYGPGVIEHLLPLDTAEVSGVRLAGVISAPELTRPSRAHLHLIVNGRWVQPRGLLAQIERAYRPLLPRGQHPILAVTLQVPPDHVDINIHPAKLDARLLAEQAVGAALGELLRVALGRRPIALTLPPSGLAAIEPPHLLAEREATWDEDGPIVTPNLPPLHLIGQVQNRLLLLEGPAGLYLIDQHRAHERILFERLRAAHGGGEPEPVALAEPLLLELRPAQAARLARRQSQLTALGFSCEMFGGRAFLLRAAPMLPGVLPGLAADDLSGLGEPDQLTATLLALADDEAAEGEEWQDRLLVSLSCRTAVRRGRPLTRRGMRALVEQLGRTSAPAVCPHGSPLLMHISGTLLETQFRWL